MTDAATDGTPVEVTRAMVAAAWSAFREWDLSEDTDSDDAAMEAAIRAAFATRPPASVSGDLDDANRACLAKRKPGEPTFIILGRDPDGATIVRLWAERRALAGGEDNHVASVRAIADAMQAWRGAGNLPNSAPPSEAYPPLPASVSGEGEVIADILESYRQVLTAPFDPSKMFGADYDKNRKANANKLIAELPKVIAFLRALPAPQVSSDAGLVQKYNAGESEG